MAKYPRTKKALLAYAQRVPKTAKDMEDILAESMARVPGADYIIMVSGFVAGMKGYTPFTALLKALGGLGGGGDIGNFLFTPGWKQILDAMTGTGQPEIAIEDKLALGCAGLIEAYMMTRPGSLQAVLGFTSGMAQAVGEIVPG